MGLKDMITRRIAHAIGAPITATPDELWNKLFEETLEYRQTKSFNYLVDRTLFRPREMIQLCIECLHHCKDDTRLVNYAVLSEAEIEYSGERLKDIAAEYRFQHPGILEVFETFRGRKYTFSRDDLEYHCLQITAGELPCKTATSWLQNHDYKQLIDVLWRVGFLKAQAAGGMKAQRRSGSQYLGSHQIDNLNLDTVPYFHVHPMFRAHLAMKE